MSFACFGEITEYAGLVYGRLWTVFFEGSPKPIVVLIDREGSVGLAGFMFPWVPASAGMTWASAGMTVVVGGNDVGVGDGVLEIRCFRCFRR